MQATRDMLEAVCVIRCVSVLYCSMLAVRVEWLVIEWKWNQSIDYSSITHLMWTKRLHVSSHVIYQRTTEGDIVPQWCNVGVRQCQTGPRLLCVGPPLFTQPVIYLQQWSVVTSLTYRQSLCSDLVVQVLWLTGCPTICRHTPVEWMSWQCAI